MALWSVVALVEVDEVETKPILKEAPNSNGVAALSKKMVHQFHWSFAKGRKAAIRPTPLRIWSASHAKNLIFQSVKLSKPVFSCQWIWAQGIEIYKPRLTSIDLLPIASMWYDLPPLHQAEWIEVESKDRQIVPYGEKSPIMLILEIQSSSCMKSLVGAPLLSLWDQIDKWCSVFWFSSI